MAVPTDSIPSSTSTAIIMPFIYFWVPANHSMFPVSFPTLLVIRSKRSTNYLWVFQPSVAWSTDLFIYALFSFLSFRSFLTHCQWKINSNRRRAAAVTSTSKLWVCWMPEWQKQVLRCKGILSLSILCPIFIVPTFTTKLLLRTPNQWQEISYSSHSHCSLSQPCKLISVCLFSCRPT